jgi:NitT/TauT family transport system permease protein
MAALSDVEPQSRPQPPWTMLQRLYRDNERFIIGGAALGAVLLIWELSARTGLVDPLLISSPIAVARAGYTLFSEGEIWRDLEVSATEFLVGYGLAAAIGIPLGVATGRCRRASYLIGPFIDTLNAVPRLTLLPLIVIWFGIGIWSKVVVVFLGAVIPIAISTHSGVKTNEARFLNVARSFGATAGIGFMIGNAGNNLRADILFFGVLLFTAAGLVSVAVLDRFERRFETWRPKVGSAA